MPQTYTWTTTGSGDHTNWTDQANWSPVGLPGSLDTAIVALNGGTLLGDNATVGTLFISGGTLGQLALGGGLTATTAEIQGNLLIANTLDAATADFTNTTTLNSTADITGAATVGDAAAGTLVVNGSGALMAGSLLVGGVFGVAGLLDAVSGSFNVTAGATVGLFGSGKLTVDQSASGNVGGDLAAGVNAGATAAIAVTHVGALSVAGNATLAASGTATLTIDASSAMTVEQNLSVALNAGAKATIDVSGDGSLGGTLAVGGDVSLAPGGSALLTAEKAGQLAVSGGDATTNRVFIGAAGTLVAQTAGGITANAIIMSDGAHLTLQSGAAATLNGATDAPLAGELIGLAVDGVATVNNAAVSATGLILVGASAGAGGTGTLEITNAANVGGNATALGQFAGNHGTLIVVGGANLSDNGSAAPDGGLTVGNAGTGVLSLQAGGVITDSLDSVIGSQATGSGTATVQGNGADWNVDGTLTVGSAGTGTLTVGDHGAATTGGTISTGALVIGGGTGGTGTAQLDGGNWANAGALVVGAVGTGALSIGTGSFTTPADITVGDSATGVGTISLTNAASQLSGDGNTVVGNAGTGTFSIGAGATYAANGDVDLGVAANSSGSLQVNGALTVNAGALNVGISGLGQFGVGAAGTVQVNGPLAVGHTGGNVHGNGTVTLAGGTIGAASITVARTDAIVGYGTIDSSGSGIDNEGLISASGTGGPLALNPVVSGAGTLQITGGGELDLAQPTSQAIVFQYSPTAEVLGLGSNAQLHTSSPIEGFRVQATIDLLGVANTLTQMQTYDPTTNVLIVSDSGVVEAVVTLDPATLGTTDFDLVPDAAGTGTDIIACFLSGTRIATVRGERKVEDLRPGDGVLTQSGRACPIGWIGHRSYAGRFVAANPQLRPVRVARFALGGGLPRRDLFLSPSHALLLDGVLVPVGSLVNGHSIARVEAAADVTYFHIELARHDVILAEGAAAETYIDEDNRMIFQNAFAAATTHQPAAPIPCAPRIASGKQLDRLRARLSRAARLPACGDLRGNLERADRRGVVGWAVDDSGGPVPLEVVVDGAVVTRLTAAGYRIDLDRAGLAEGACGFAVAFQPPLSERCGEIIVRRASDAALLPGAPRRLHEAA